MDNEEEERERERGREEDGFLDVRGQRGLQVIGRRKERGRYRGRDCLLFLDRLSVAFIF